MAPLISASDEGNDFVERAQSLSVLDLDKKADSYIETCFICGQIMEAFTDPNFWDGRTGEPIELENHKSSTCQGHTPLLNCLLQRAPAFFRLPDSFTIARPSIGPEIRFDFTKVTPQRSTSRWGISTALVHRDDKPSHPGLGRILDQEWVDLDIVRRWISACKETHGDKCDNRFAIEPVEPTWLIDVKRNCLVSGANSKEYVALSYCWGQGKNFKTMTRMLDRLQTPGSLLEPEVSELMPASIRHVIDLVSVFGYSYVWIDAICIAQDDETTKSQEIGQMAALYATAVVTIILGDGDAAQGIRGLRNISTPRHLTHQQIFPFLGDSEHIIIYNPGRTECPGPYNSRGWTFQENIMARRRLIFSHEMVHWECACAIWHEDHIPVIDEQSNGSPTGHELLSILNESLDTTTFHNLIAREYASREFTFNEDCLPALTGTLNLIRKKFGHGFLYGIPEAFFDFFLVWRGGDLQRRKPTAVSSRPSIFPTWSWVGWMGGSSAIGGSHAYVVQSQQVLCKHDFVPIVEWYTGAEINGPWRRIKPYWYENVQNARDPDWKPPAGWSKKRIEESTSERVKSRDYCKPPQGLGDFIFTNPILPETEFWCPIPIFQADDESKPNMWEDTPYISCRAQRLRLTPSRDVGPGPAHQKLSFANVGGEIIGSLWPNGREQWVEAEAAIGKDPQIELVAIMKSEWSESWYKGPSQFRRSMYLALWIGWEDGIASRKGVAEIHRSFWDSQKQESVSIVIG